MCNIIISNLEKFPSYKFTKFGLALSRVGRWWWWWAKTPLTRLKFLVIHHHMLRAAKPAEAVLTTLRSFPRLEPVSVQPVSTKILGLPTRRDILWQAVVYERDAERVGSRVIVGRDDMGYSGRKLLPQKGSGRARQGDRGNPIRHDGGRAHARPAPGDMSTGLPSQVYSLAMRTALSAKYREGHLYIVDGPAELAHESELVGREFVKTHGLNRTAIAFVLDQHRPNLFNALQSNDRADIIPKEFLQVQDVLKARRLIIERAAFEYLVSKFRPPSELKPIAAEFA